MNSKEKDLDARCPYHCNEKIGQCNNPSQETPHTYCIDNKDCIYKQYARKEQECEELKEINSTLLEYRRHAVACQECYEDGLEDGKTSNKELRKLKQTLAEIKELAEANVGYFPDGEMFARSEIEQIINKINEVIDE